MRTFNNQDDRQTNRLGFLNRESEVRILPGASMGWIDDSRLGLCSSRGAVGEGHSCNISGSG